MTTAITPVTLSALLGVIVSLVFRFFPGLQEWYESQTTARKQLIMAGVLLVITVAIYGFSCAGVLGKTFPDWEVACTEDGLWFLINVFIAALISNQSTYQITKK